MKLNQNIIDYNKYQERVQGSDISKRNHIDDILARETERREKSGEEIKVPQSVEGVRNVYRYFDPMRKHCWIDGAIKLPLEWR